MYGVLVESNLYDKTQDVGKQFSVKDYRGGRRKGGDFPELERVAVMIKFQNTILEDVLHRYPHAGIYRH